MVGSSVAWPGVVRVEVADGDRQGAARVAPRGAGAATARADAARAAGGVAGAAVVGVGHQVAAHAAAGGDPAGQVGPAMDIDASQKPTVSAAPPPPPSCDAREWWKYQRCSRRRDGERAHVRQAHELRHRRHRARRGRSRRDRRRVGDVHDRRDPAENSATPQKAHPGVERASSSVVPRSSTAPVGRSMLSAPPVSTYARSHPRRTDAARGHAVRRDRRRGITRCAVSAPVELSSSRSRDGRPRRRGDRVARRVDERVHHRGAEVGDDRVVARANRGAERREVGNAPSPSAPVKELRVGERDAARSAPVTETCSAERQLVVPGPVDPELRPRTAPTRHTPTRRCGPRGRACRARAAVVAVAHQVAAGAVAGRRPRGAREHARAARARLARGTRARTSRSWPGRSDDGAGAAEHLARRARARAARHTWPRAQTLPHTPQCIGSVWKVAAAPAALGRPIEQPPTWWGVSSGPGSGGGVVGGWSASSATRRRVERVSRGDVGGRAGSLTYVAHAAGRGDATRGSARRREPRTLGPETLSRRRAE